MNRPPRRSTLFPYTTLSRSRLVHEQEARLQRDRHSDVGQLARALVQRVGPSLRHAFETEPRQQFHRLLPVAGDRKSTRLNSSHANISYAVFCLKKKNKNARR